MPSSEDKPKARRVIDVTEPGKSEPSASSRPIIVSNRPIMKQDPMVIADDTIQDEPIKNPSTVTLKIQPPESGSEPKEITSAPSVPKKTAAKTNDEKKPHKDYTESESIPVSIVTPPVSDDKPEKVVASEVPTEMEKKDNPIAEATSGEEVIPKAGTEINAVEDPKKNPETDKDQIEPNKVVDEAKQKEEAAKVAKQQELEKIIDSKKYFLPINSVEHRKDTRKAIGVLLVVILLALVWLDLILDAGLIKINGIHAVTHFFSS